jgi:3-isopropylmalate/(R)-2-methylmalate dehydratase large subunit
MVARPNLPSRSVPVGDVAGTKVDQVFIGSCTNARIEDLRVAAHVLGEESIAPSIRAMVIPATQRVWRQANAEGLLDRFAAAGASVSTPTCGACLGAHMGVLGPGERCLSTSNRNYVGRMGDPTAQVYLANPAVAMATAVAGEITHPADVRSVAPDHLIAPAPKGGSPTGEEQLHESPA